MNQSDFELKHCYIKENVSIHEFKMHQYVYNLNIVNIPKIYDYNKTTKRLVLQKIDNMCISDFYGEQSSDICDELFEKIQDIIKTLYAANIEYPDITGYNFIEKDDKIWIIDFEHSKYCINPKPKNKFIQKFISGYNGWNPEFY
jgi:tRNA A-37 threonylcarbamoyl transferase component Bud32